MAHFRVVSFEENVDRMIYDQLQEIDDSFCWVPGKRKNKCIFTLNWRHRHKKEFLIKGILFCKEEQVQ